MPSTALQIARKKFTDEEQQLIAAMSKPGAQVEVCFPRRNRRQAVEVQHQPRPAGCLSAHSSKSRP